MILVKNRLKKIKRDNEDDMLHYLKYSHLDDIPEEDLILCWIILNMKIKQHSFQTLGIEALKHITKKWT